MVSHRLESTASRYGVVFPIVGLAALCRIGFLVLGGDLQSTAFGPFYGAIVAATLLGGLGPGGLALALSLVASLTLYEPDGSPPVSAAVPGLVAKFWISDGSRWGAVMVFESDAAARQALPPNRAAELIGSPAPMRLTFDVEAFVTGTRGGTPWL